MTPEQQLRAALEFRASTASPSPGALAEIRGRADRRRWTARLQVGVAGVAVVGIAAGAFALADGGRARLEPAPPAGSQSPDPTPQPSTPAQTTPTPNSASPAAITPTGVVGPDEFVAVLGDRRVVVASASTGRITREVTSLHGSLSRGVSLELAPDRRTAYVAWAPDDECRTTIERLDLRTGELTHVAAGSAAEPSPDGGRIAYLAAGCDVAPALVVQDLATGRTVRYPHSTAETRPDGEPEPWALHTFAWHADGRRLWLGMEWENMTQLRLLDPVLDRTTTDAERFRTEHVALRLERRGPGLVFLHQCCYPEFTEDSLIVLRDAAGRERELVRAPAEEMLEAPEAGPDGDLLYTRSGRLYRMDVETGQTTDLAASTAIARDW